MTDLKSIVENLYDHNVEFIVVGGLAATMHGSVRFTLDVDVLYRRTPENYDRLVSALATHSPYLRGAPPGLPFRWDKETIRRGLNFTLTTDLGPLDLLGEIVGGGDYDRLLPESDERVLFGMKLRCLSLERLILTKRAAGRVKDFEALSELEALLRETRKNNEAV